MAVPFLVHAAMAVKQRAVCLRPGTPLARLSLGCANNRGFPTQTLMTDDNPYAPPNAVDVIILDDKLACVDLANRSTRFVACFIDHTILVMIGVFAMFLAIAGHLPMPTKGEDRLAWFSNGFLVLHFFSFLLINGYSLKTNGQTIGKKLTRIRLADRRGNVPSVAKAILLRYVPFVFMFPWSLPGIILCFLDILFVFRGNRRCLHDLLAGTRVVKMAQPK
jgi:uncharacterized RDD family membrane protein YckC